MSQGEIQSDADLVARLTEGENPALDILMQRYQKPLYFFILRYVHDEYLAYDLVQETFLRVFTRAASYKLEYRFSTWLYQIALNLCRDNGRKQALRKFFSLPGDNECVEAKPQMLHDACIEDRFDTKHQIHFLHREISRLPHKLKAALVLYALEEKSQAVCSEILGISQKAVETRVYRARKILQQKISDYFEGKPRN
jgi:RNA polymerase sigma-70 factor (ECF subfamily)